MESLLNDSKMFQVAEIELVYHVNVKASQRPKIASARDAYSVFMKSWSLGRIHFIEEFKIMLLNQGSRVLGITTISVGGLTSTTADVRLIFAAALKGNAKGLILAHNHTSGQRKASRADQVITNQIVEAGKLLDISVVDHLIVTSESFMSFSEEGIL